MDQISYSLERKHHLDSIKRDSSLLKDKLIEVLSNDHIQSVEEQYRKDSISDPIIPEDESSFEERFEKYIIGLEKEDGEI